MLIARTSALEEMASGIAHELNQPIGAIATFAQTAERMLALPTPMVGEARGILRHVSEEALKAGRGVHRIRELFRDNQAPRQTCDLTEVLLELKPILELLAERTSARLEWRIESNLPSIHIDRLRIQHVVFTLVQNALEAPCRDGETPAVLVDARADKYEITVSVSDNGVGVFADEREQLFRPFFTTKPNGTGLGLASSRAIVEAHEGAIGFEPREYGGSRFWFRLPVAAGEV